MRKLLLRADGNTHIGFGHLYRILALAGLMAEKYTLHAVLFETSPFMLEALRQVCTEVTILPGTLPAKTPDDIAVTEEIPFDMGHLICPGDVVVLDGYYFGEAYQQAVIEAGAKLVCIDDLATRHFAAHAVINHAPGLDAACYRHAPYTRVYTGLDYALLRPPFLVPWPAPEQRSEALLLSMGGSDYFGFSRLLLEYVLSLPVPEINLLCSAAFPQPLLDHLQEQAAQQPGRIRLHQNLGGAELVALMDHCRYALVSASTVLIEAAARGLHCITGYYTRNQQFIYNGFVRSGLALPLGDFNTCSPGLMEQAWAARHSVHTLTAVPNPRQTLNAVFDSLG